MNKVSYLAYATLVSAAVFGSVVLAKKPLSQALTRAGSSTAGNETVASNQVGTAINKVGTHPGGIGLTPDPVTLIAKPGDQLAAFSEGCFWGSENTFRHVKGVIATAVGFTGGHITHPTYEQVCTHTTGECETVLVEFNPKVVSYDQLLFVFWNSHDPTQVGGQGPDEGDNYRSAIWTFGKDEQTEAISSEKKQQGQLQAPITTTIQPIGTFWMAEDYHQQYDEKNGVAACPVFLRKPLPDHQSKG